MYQRLEDALSGLVGGEKPIKGTLGYTIDGAYRVMVAENAAKYYVRFGDGSFAQVYHRGRASPVPDLPVEVGYDSAGNMVIVGGDPDRAGLFAGTHEVGPHSHARGSGMEFDIDPRLLTPVRAVPLTGLTVSVAQGAYRYGGALRWWSGGAITLTPPGSANQWAWVVIGLDPAAGTLVAANGSSVVVSAPLEPSTIPAISLPGAIPLAAVRVRNGQTELDEADFEDLRYPLAAMPIALDDLSDVDTSGASDGEVLTYASGTWTAQAVSSEASVTTTGNIDNLDFGGATLVRMNNASDATIRGLAAGKPGQVVTIVSVGAGNVSLAHQNTGSSAANRLINTVTSIDTPLAAGKGYATYSYDGTTQRWRLVEHQMGSFLSYTPTWSAAGSAPSLGNGTLLGLYYIVGREVMIRVALNPGSTTTFGTGQWQFALPFASQAGLVAAGYAQDSSLGANYLVSVLYGAGFFVVFTQGSATFTGTIPFTWATSDALYVAVNFLIS